MSRTLKFCFVIGDNKTYVTDHKLYTKWPECQYDYLYAIFSPIFSLPLWTHWLENSHLIKRAISLDTKRRWRKVLHLRSFLPNIFLPPRPLFFRVITPQQPSRAPLPPRQRWEPLLCPARKRQSWRRSGSWRAGLETPAGPAVISRQPPPLVTGLLGEEGWWTDVKRGLEESQG